MTTALQILQVASRLFARQGYSGTSTRNIAEGVGISQPALYKHFASKDNILRARADELLDPWLAVLPLTRDRTERASVRLCWLFDKVCRDLAAAEYDVLPLLSEPALRTPEFAGVQRKYRQVSRAFRDLIAEGTSDGDFRPLDPEFAQAAVLSLPDVLIFPSEGPLDVLIDPVVEFALRALLVRPAESARVVTRARRWAARGARP